MRPLHRRARATLRPARAGRAATLLALLLALPALSAQAQQLTLAPVADTTLYSEDGNGANGAGEGLFTGRTGLGERRRALLRFDLSALPAGATLLSAELELSMDRSIVGAVPVRAHRVLASWGEGSAHAPGQEGIAAPAGTGDATWQWRFHASDAWAAPGGDLAAQPSAETSVAGPGRYTFSGPGLLADIEAWRVDPAANHGWLLLADEQLPAPTAKRFASREHADPALRPLLRIAYGTAGPPPAHPARSIPATGTLALLLLLALLVATALTTLPRR